MIGGIVNIFTGKLIGTDGQNGGAVITCCTEIVPEPDQMTVTGFAFGDPTIVPPVTVQSKLTPDPTVVALYAYVKPGHIVCGPVMEAAGGGLITLTDIDCVGLQYAADGIAVAVTVCGPVLVHVTLIELVPLPVNVPPVTIQLAFVDA